MSTARPPATADAAAYDVEARRAEFPILARTVWDKPLVYLDNAATTQKPAAVIEAIDGFYRAHNSNVHRGVHRLSQEATEAFEGARETVRGFVNAADTREVVFVRGTTEGINLVAQSYGRSTLKPGDEILVTRLEHHSNIVPWQIVAEQTGAKVIASDVTPEGALDLDDFRSKLSERVKIVAVGHVSNALGTINPVAELARLTHEVGAIIVVDGAQAAPHLKIDVHELDVDFYAISGHKMYGPTGIGALWGRGSLLEQMPPWHGGGDMIDRVTIEKTTWNVLPHKFEAGTPNIADAIALSAAIDWIETVGIENIAAWEEQLLDYATPRVEEIPDLRIIGTARPKAGVLSMVMEGLSSHDIGTILDQEGIAIRAGHHCTQR